MSRRHHAALSAVYAVYAIILALDGEFAHAGCAFVAALIYADSCRHKHDRDEA
jgi:hypothetical protein